MPALCLEPQAGTPAGRGLTPLRGGGAGGARLPGAGGVGVGGTRRGAVGISRHVMSEVRAPHWTAEWLCARPGPEGLDTGALASASASDGADSGPRLPRRRRRARGRGLRRPPAGGRGRAPFPSCVHAYSKRHLLAPRSVRRVATRLRAGWSRRRHCVCRVGGRDKGAVHSGVGAHRGRGTPAWPRGRSCVVGSPPLTC